MNNLEYLKRSSLFVYFLFFSLFLQAQLGEPRNNWAVGGNFGVNQNSVTFLPRIKQSSDLLFTGGVTARYISEKYFAIICGLQAEVNFSQRGWTENIENSPDQYARTMNYLEIPLLAHLAFGKETPGAVQFFINLGPQLGYLINEKATQNFTGIGTTERPNNVVEQYGMMADQKLDYGLVGGGGLELKTGIGNFLVEGRYYYGLANFYKSTKKDDFQQSSHSTLSVKVSYLVDLTH